MLDQVCKKLPQHWITRCEHFLPCHPLEEHFFHEASSEAVLVSSYGYIR